MGKVTTTKRNKRQAAIKYVDEEGDLIDLDARPLHLRHGDDGYEILFEVDGVKPSLVAIRITDIREWKDVEVL